MKVRIELEVEDTNDLDDDELVDFHTAVIDYLKDDLLPFSSDHECGEFAFTVQSVKVTDTTSESSE